MPVTEVLPKSSGIRSGWRCSRAVRNLSREVALVWLNRRFIPRLDRHARGLSMTRTRDGAVGGTVEVPAILTNLSVPCTDSCRRVRAGAWRNRGRNPKNVGKDADMTT